MSGEESSAAPWAERWSERMGRVAQLAPVRTLRRWVVGDDVDGELRVVDATHALGTSRPLRAPVLVLGFVLGVAGPRVMGFGWKGFVAGALLGWVLGGRIYRGAVPYALADPTELRGVAEDLEVGNWLRVRPRGLVRRAARATNIEDAGPAVRVTLSNGHVKEWSWRKRVADLVMLELPWPASPGPRKRCLYAQAGDELPAVWDLPPCGGEATWSIGAQRLCEAHAQWAVRTNPGLRPRREVASEGARAAQEIEGQ
jgi:hypothetical protein